MVRVERMFRHIYDLFMMMNSKEQIAAMLSTTKPCTEPSLNISSERDSAGSERSSETKDLILDIIKQNPRITAIEIAMQLNMSSRGVEKRIRKLREADKININPV